MKLAFALSWIRAAIRHVNGNERYRWWPLYSACLAVFMYSTYYWPFSMDVVIAYRLHPWLMDLSHISWDVGAYLCIGLGAVGLLRSNWLARGLSLCGLWMGQHLLLQLWDPLGWLWSEVVWYTFDLPGKLIHGYAGEGTAAATFLWFVYAALVWLAIRPLMKRGYKKVLRLESWILETWPVMKRFEKPVM